MKPREIATPGFTLGRRLEKPGGAFEALSCGNVVQELVTHIQGHRGRGAWWAPVLDRFVSAAEEYEKLAREFEARRLAHAGNVVMLDHERCRGEGGAR